MRLSTSPIVRTVRTLLPLVALLVLGTLPAAPNAVASPARHAPDGVSSTLLKVQASGAPFGPSTPNLTRIAAGRSARIVLYAYFTGITAPMAVRVSLFARRGSTLVFASAGTFTVGRAQLGGASSGWRWYWNDVGGTTKSRGQLTFRGVISGGGVTQVRQTSLTVF